MLAPRHKSHHRRWWTHRHFRAPDLQLRYIEGHEQKPDRMCRFYAHRFGCRSWNLVRFLRHFVSAGVVFLRCARRCVLRINPLVGHRSCYLCSSHPPQPYDRQVSGRTVFGRVADHGVVLRGRAPGGAPLSKGPHGGRPSKTPLQHRLRLLLASAAPGPPSPRPPMVSPPSLAASLPTGPTSGRQESNVGPAVRLQRDDL